MTNMKGGMTAQKVIRINGGPCADPRARKTTLFAMGAAQQDKLS